MLFKLHLYTQNLLNITFGGLNLVNYWLTLGTKLYKYVMTLYIKMQLLIQ